MNVFRKCILKRFPLFENQYFLVRGMKHLFYIISFSWVSKITLSPLVKRSGNGREKRKGMKKLQHLPDDCESLALPLTCNVTAYIKIVNRD